jgi:hypothetical protein
MAVTTAHPFLIGTWKNRLGSEMKILQAVDDNFFGVYKTAVSGKGAPLEAPVTGVFNKVTDAAGTIAFNVNWKYAGKNGETVHSTSSWAGVVRGDTLSALWLLARYGPKETDWENTNTGKDEFTKISP